MNNDETRRKELWFCGGIVAGAIFVFFLTGLLSSFPSAPAAHVFLLMVAVLIVSGVRRLRVRSALMAFAWGVASTLIASTVAGAWMSTAIARDASEKAAGQSYCLYVSDGGIGYRTVRHLLDLSPMRMWAHDGGPVRFQFHAVLVVETNGQATLYNWSYRQRQFRPFDGVRNNAARSLPPCTPKQRFVDDLPLL